LTLRRADISTINYEHCHRLGIADAEQYDDLTFMVMKVR
jgi:hypothetical protein